MGLLVSRMTLARLGGVKDEGSTESDSALTKPLLAEEQTAPFDPQCRLPEADHHKTTGRTHCLMDTYDKEVMFRLEHPNGNTTTLLTARRGPIWSRIRFLMAVDGVDEPVAKLTLQQSSFTSVCYALEISDGAAVAYIHYPVPSLWAVLRQRPSRQAEVVLLDQVASKEDPEALKTFREVCEQRLGGPRSVLATPDTRNSVGLRSVAPRVKANGRCGISLAGRARRASRRNMRLVRTDRSKGGHGGSYGGGADVLLQMAKWDTKVYHVDFCSPVTPLQAFGWALAQIDLN